MLAGPARWDQHFRRAAASATLSVLYGYPTLKSDQDHIVKAINDFIRASLYGCFYGCSFGSISPLVETSPSQVSIVNTS